MSIAPETIARLSPDEKRALAARLLREKAAAQALAHRLFETQARRTPDAVAVRFGGRDLTYAQIDAASNRLARRLRAMGVGPESRVGLCLGRSPEMVVGLLATLKAGGAYVPLDPTYPPERLAFMLGDCRAAVLLTTAETLAALPFTEARDLCVDRDADAIAAELDEPLVGGASSEDLAYIIYTSGSTGRPKGAMIVHRGLTNYLTWAVKEYDVESGCGAPVHSSVAFDLTVTSLLVPLAAGRRVDLLEEGPGVEALAEALRSGSNYSLVKLTPVHLQLLGERLHPEEVAGRARAFVIGGEQLTADQVAFWRRHAPGTALINEYGPTETVVGCCIHRIPRDAEIAGAVPIGKPIANTRLYVLDARMRPVPTGVSGELYIGGAGVARGYLDRPSLTAERFVPDPFGKSPGARLYRTGDLARWRADGDLEFLGRVDDQVKIRGYRVELGEIELSLARHPGVRQAAVSVHEDATGDRRLIGYIVASGEPPDAAPLRAFLSETLPDYMVPSAFLTIDSLPLTPNGKVDRKALPAPEERSTREGAAYVPPRGPIEEALVGAWCELLGVERVGVHDNFFDVGGHSLIATRLVARLRDTFGVEPPLRSFLEAPTVAALARVVERELAAGAGLLAPPIRPVPRDRPLPASFAQQRLWFLDQLEPGGAAYNVPVAVRLAGELDVPSLHRALNEVVRRHEVLRTTFAAIDGVPHQVIAPDLAIPDLAIPMPLTDLSTMAEGDREAEVFRLLRDEAGKPFDLARGPLIRAGLIRASDREHVIYVTLHHIASDGWSMGILTREVAAIYEAFRLGHRSPLPEPALQYADYAAWQRDWLRGDVLDAQLDYWRDQLSGVATLELPTDRPRPPAMSGRGGERTVTFPAEMASSLKALGRKDGATLFMTLLSAFDVLLHRYSGQMDIAVGTPIAGRTRSEVEDLIGFFINTLVLRGDLSGDPSFREVLRRTRQAALGAYAHQDLPFEQMVNVLHPTRDSGRTPLFQVMFALQNAPPPPLESGELTLQPIDAGGAIAKFDLTLIMREDASGLHATLEYSTDLFDAATADRMLGHLRNLLDAILASPEAPISTLAMLSEQERLLLLGGGGDSDGDAAGLDGLSDDELESLLGELASEGEAVDE